MTERRPHTESELIELVRSIDESASPALHARVQELIDERAAVLERPRWRLSGRGRAPLFTGGLAAAAAAAAAIVVVALSGGGTSPNVVPAASRLTLSAATMAAPTESVSHHMELAAAVDGVSFPYWEESLGWRSTGTRVDRLGGRSVRTVFYADAHGRRIGYAIVGGTPPLPIDGGRVTWRGGRAYRLLDVNGAQAVAWLRGGRLCVVSGRGVDGATLLRLASWHNGGVAA